MAKTEILSSLNSANGGKSGGSPNFLVVLKIYGGDVHLDGAKAFNITCRDPNSQAKLQVFVISSSQDDVLFQQKRTFGQIIEPTDLVLFMTAPVDGIKEVVYELEISKPAIGSKPVGSAYVHLDPKISTKGSMRMDIVGMDDTIPIGQIQVQYLVIKDPIAYGVKAPRPDWLCTITQLDAGHRGAGSGCRGDLPGNITENTVASFNYAARHGADMCELDVMCTADGVPVVYHNYILNESHSNKQIDQLTLKELKALNDGGTHDENCKHDLENSTQMIKQESSRPFPTLEEVLRDVDEGCALNIELKWAQLLPNGKSEAVQSREINDFVDRILSCIYQHSNGRSIVLSSFSTDIAVMLRLKQTKYPVLFLTTGDSQRFNDPATKTIKNAIHFAQAFDMAGINSNVTYLNEHLVKFAKDRGLLVYAWGKIESAQAIRDLKRIGLNGVIYDRIDLIKPQD